MHLVYVAAAYSDIAFKKRQKILEIDRVNDKLRYLVAMMSHEKEVLELGQKIQNRARSEMNKSQRDYYLRQQLKAIKKELGESGEEESETADFRNRIENSAMSEEARGEALKELDRFAEMTPQSAEYSMAKTYLEWLLNLPWGNVSEDQTHIVAARNIFIDELDALGKARGYGTVGGHDEREQTLNQLLVELDGFDPNIGIILMAATNRPEILDPALLRPGRFDRQILVDRPDKIGRAEILRVHLNKVTAADDLNVDTLAGMTAGMVGADLANLVNEAALLSVRRNKAAIGMAEFGEAIERVVAGLEKKNRLINPKEKEIVTYHELGHAVIAMSLPETDPVQKISIIPRGIAALGYTMQVPTEDRFLMGRTELLNRIATLLGGRAAEEIFFDDNSTGAHNDLSRATDIARSMVKEYGMSRALGQVYFAHDNPNPFMVQNSISSGNYSEMTANLINKEIRRIIDEQYEKVLEILSSNQDIIHQDAEKLLEDEVIEGEALKELSDAVSQDSASAGRAGGSDTGHAIAA